MNMMIKIIIGIVFVGLFAGCTSETLTHNKLITTPSYFLQVEGDLYYTGNINITGCIIYNGGILGDCVGDE